MAKNIKIKPKSTENLNQQSTLRTARVSAYHCAHLLCTIQHTAVLPLILQTFVIAQTLSTVEKGEWHRFFYGQNTFQPSN